MLNIRSISPVDSAVCPHQRSLSEDIRGDAAALSPLQTFPAVEESRRDLWWLAATGLALAIAAGIFYGGSLAMIGIKPLWASPIFLLAAIATTYFAWRKIGEIRTEATDYHYDLCIAWQSYDTMKRESYDRVTNALLAGEAGGQKNWAWPPADLSNDSNMVG